MGHEDTSRPSHNYYVVQMPKGRGFETTGNIGMMCVTKAKRDTTIEVNGMNRKVPLYTFLYWVGQ